MKKLFKLVVIGALVAGAVKMMGMKKQEWQGLTESEARSKLDAKLPSKIAGDKRTEVTEKIVGAMKEKGVISPDPAPVEVAEQPAGEDEPPADDQE